MDESIRKRLEILRFRIEDDARRDVSRASSTADEMAKSRGKLLKIKFGHNPNSSGIGTSSLIFLWSVSIATVVFSTVTAWVASSKKRSE